MSEPSLEIRMFGGLELVYHQQVITTVNSPRLQSLLAYLLLHAGTPQLRRHVAFLLWPDSSEAHARNSMRNLLHQLRQALPDADQFIQTDAETMLWRATADCKLDVAIFELLVAQSGQEESDSVQAALEQAVGLYRGDLLPACYDEWIAMRREQLRLMYAEALNRLIRLYGAQDNLPLALQAAERLRLHDPLQETAYAHLLRLAAASGDYARARQIYQAAADLLQREFGAEPGPELSRLYETVLARQPPTTGAPSVLTTGDAPLVGRASEMAQMQQIWHELRPGHPQVILLSGEPGIGKSRMAQEMIQWVAQQHGVTISAHCYAGDGNLAYAPVAEWLRAPIVTNTIANIDSIWQRELLRFLPEMRSQYPSLDNPPPLTEPWQRRQLLEAPARTLLALSQPLLLFLDDWQWCDWETLEWLNFLLHFSADSSLFILGALRSEEVSQNQRLRSLLLSWQGTGCLTVIELGPLSEAETIVLANRVAGQELDAAQAVQVAQETEGNPLFVVEYVRSDPQGFTPRSAPTHAGDLRTKAASGSLELPARVQATIEYRLSLLSASVLWIAGTAAVVGRRFTSALLAEVSGKPEEEVVQCLDELCSRRVTREVDGGIYDFSHDKVREVAYAQLSITRRQMIHRSVGLALTQLPLEDRSAVSAQAAFHFEQANSLDQAVRYYIQAATAAAELNAYHRASQLYARATEIAGKLNLPSATLIQIYTQHGRMLEHGGDFAAAIRVYQDLQSLALRRADIVMEATAVAQLAAAYSEPTSTHDLQQAQSMLTRGLALARQQGDRDLEARLLWSQMVTASHYGDDQAAQASGVASLACCREHQLHGQLPFVLNDLATNLRLSGRQEEGQRHAEEARWLFQKNGNMPMLADNLTQQAWHDYHQLRFADCLHWVEASIALCRKIGNGWNLSLAVATRCLVKTMLGEWGDALVDYEESTRIGTAAGFAIATTLIPACYGALLRTLGLGDRATALHQEAHDAAHRQLPFALSAIEAQLAQDAFAAGENARGMQWLQAGLVHQPQGAISRAWITLADLPSAMLAAAHATGDWTQAASIVEERLAEAQQRHLPVYLPQLELAQAHCCLAAGALDAAETHLRAANALAERANLVPILWHAQQYLAILSLQQQRPAEVRVHQQQAIAHMRTLAASVSDDHIRHAFLTTPAVQATLFAHQC